MALTIDHEDIWIHQGDTMKVPFFVWDHINREPYIVEDGDTLTFMVKEEEDDEAYIVVEPCTVENDPDTTEDTPCQQLYIELSSTDTFNIPVGTYYYNVLLTMEDGTKRVVIPKIPGEAARLRVFESLADPDGQEETVLANLTARVAELEELVEGMAIQAGDTITNSYSVIGGLLTGAGKDVIFTVPFTKSVLANNVTITGGTITVRQQHDSNTVLASNIDVTDNTQVSEVVANVYETGVRVRVSFVNALSGQNNAECSVECQFSYLFS